MEHPLQSNQSEEGPVSFQDYHLSTMADKSIEGSAITNDDQDLGYPNTEANWPVKFRDRADLERRVGKSHLGCSGVRVRVYLDDQFLI
tara:strand:- start:22 stop:285 length:264 start_codon:yes stop_codon:yes gene_type:complete